MNERPNIEQIKVELAAAIARLIDEHRLTDMTAGYRLTLAPTEVARLRSGDLTAFSIDHLVSVLNTLNQRVHMTINPDPTVVATTKAADTRPIWEKIAEITARVPPEEWEKLPTDLAAHHDHYLYGTPKRD